MAEPKSVIGPALPPWVDDTLSSSESFISVSASRMSQRQAITSPRSSVAGGEVGSPRKDRVR